MAATALEAPGWGQQPAEVLAHARAQRRLADAAEAELLVTACTWADLHPAETIADAARVHDPAYGETEVALAGDGAPLVAEFSIAEFAAVLALPTAVGGHLIGEALELRHRLPRLWARVQAGDLPAWRARRIARATTALTKPAAGYVDRHVAAVAHTISPGRVDMLVAEAIARLMPETAEARRRQAADGRHLHVDDHQVSFTGTVHITGELDLADGLDLDAALAQGAEALTALGSTDTLDVRRSIAAGDLARRQLALDLTPTDSPADTPDGAPIDTPADSAAPERSGGAPSHQQTSRRGGARPGRARPAVVLHLHLSQDAVTGTGNDVVHLGRVANNRTPVTADTIRSWCGTAGRVVVQQVLDLADHAPVDSYEIPDRMTQQVRLRDHCCVFPWCPTRATRCDTDHVIPHAVGGPTCACNLAPLCRRHHRLKTHGRAWTYTAIEPGSYLWTTPAGYQLLRDHTGTRDVTHHAPVPPRRPHPPPGPSGPPGPPGPPDI